MPAVTCLCRTVRLASDRQLWSRTLRQAGRRAMCSDDASYITGTTLTPDGGFALTE